VTCCCCWTTTGLFRVTAVAPLGPGAMLASGAADGIVRLWNGERQASPTPFVSVSALKQSAPGSTSQAAPIRQHQSGSTRSAGRASSRFPIGCDESCLQLEQQGQQGLAAAGTAADSTAAQHATCITCHSSTALWDPSRLMVLGCLRLLEC
jgi:WD40 repeat protein